MVTSQVERIKNNSEEFDKFINSKNNGEIVLALRKLGRLENGNLKKNLIKLADYENENVRFYAIKNLAKLCDIELLDYFREKFHEESSTKVKREIVSAVGRLRKIDSIPLLLDFLDSKDPKITMQAIRGLLVFKNNSNVRNRLLKMKNHPNEIIQEIIDCELGEWEVAKKKCARHNQSPDYLKNVVVNADVLEALKLIPNNSIHLTFTSPPYYNARDYSIYQSYKQYLQFLEKVFKETHRITKEGRFFILNTSPIIIPRFSRAHSSKRYPIPFDIHPLLIEIGWEFIDDIVWVKPEASAKRRNAGFLQHRKPLAYKPNPITEMVMVYRKNTRKLIDWNIRQYPNSIIEKSKVNDDYETSNVWNIEPSMDKIHTAVFPIELCNRVIRYYSFVDDLVFDPFAGRGTMGKSALKNYRRFFLVENNQAYIERVKEYLGEKLNLLAKERREIHFYNLKEFSRMIKNESIKSSD